MRNVRRKYHGDCEDDAFYYWNGDRYTARELTDIIIGNVPKMTVSELINILIDRSDLDDLKEELADYIISEFTKEELIAMIIPAAERIEDE